MITKEQLNQDKFVQLKSLQKCIKEGYIRRNYHYGTSYYSFCNVKNDPSLAEQMIPLLGTVLDVYNPQMSSHMNWISLEDPRPENHKEVWLWPLEVIEK